MEEKKQYSALTIDRAAFLLLRVKKAFKKKKLQRKERERRRDMEWPSKTVAHGGILHPAKASYSSETHTFLKTLMDESKLSMQVRRSINYHLRNGEPLPPPTSRSSGETSARSKLPRIVVRPGSSKRRTRDTILRSGAYERERYIRREPLVDRDKEKVRLINKLVFGENVEPKPPKIKPKQVRDGAELNRFDQLEREIREREEFLGDMEKLGEGTQHKLVIQQQIQARVREMGQLRLADSR